MRAVGYRQCLPADHPESLLDIELPAPRPGARDLLVQVQAVSVNPVDTKVRQRTSPAAGTWGVLGWDAAGTVVDVGSDVRGFAVGDAVYYAGALERQGTNAEYHCVDERLVARKPGTLGWGDAAALPLTALTAWEALFDRLEVHRPVPGPVQCALVIGGGGGVGSIAIQLLRQLTDVTVVATAGRAETADWVRELGAHHVIDHGRPLSESFAAQGLPAPGFVFPTTQTDRHFAEIVKLVAPQGRIALIDDPKQFDILPFKRRSVSVHWEFMYTRSMHATADMAEQGRILAEVAGLVDAGRLRTTVGARYGGINAANLRRAHQTLESGTARGKIVLEGFG